MDRALVVMGAANCLEADLLKLNGYEADFMAINRSGVRITLPIAWWVTYHPATFLHERWAEKRAAIGANTNFTAVCHERNAGLERKLEKPLRVVAGPRLTGSSALFGVLFGLELGYPKIIVAGAPLTQPDYVYFQEGWRLQAAALRGRVSSLSGWTKTFLEGLNHGA